MSSSLLGPKHSSMAGSWSSNPLDAGASPPSCTSGYQSVPPVRLSYLHLVPVAMLWLSVGAQHKQTTRLAVLVPSLEQFYL